MGSVSCVCLLQRVLSKDGNLLSKTSSGMQSGGEEEQDEEAHTPLPPPMEIIKDPSAQDDKVRGGRREEGEAFTAGLSWRRLLLETETDLQSALDSHVDWSLFVSI